MTRENLDSIFRAYDIRGRCPQELSADFFFDLGCAYATRFKPASVVVGNDIRPESMHFKRSLIAGLLDSGVDVTDLGEISTEMLYFAAGEYTNVYDGGLVVTASHNPSGWNGCKLVGPGAIPIGKASGLLDLKKIIIDESYEKVSQEHGNLSDFYVYPEYKAKVRSFLTSKKLPELKIIVDAGNGIGGRVFDYVFGDLDLDVTRMYFVPDGNFPHHVPHPAEEENVVELKKRVLEEKADLGMAIDGDADRVFFIDKKGRKPDGVYTGVLLARHLLKSSTNKRIVNDPRLTWPFEKEADKFDAETFLSVAGHSYFKQKMAEKRALFGAEASAHFYYRDFYNCDSAMVTIALMLQMYSEGFELTPAVDELFEKYPNSGEVNYKVDDADKMLEKLESHYAGQSPKISHVDGVSIEFEDWRFNLRKSNTQPLIRLNLEAKDKAAVIERFREVEALIGFPRENSPVLKELI